MVFDDAPDGGVNFADVAFKSVFQSTFAFKDDSDPATGDKKTAFFGDLDVTTSRNENGLISRWKLGANVSRKTFVKHFDLLLGLAQFEFDSCDKAAIA